jgi:hypothetical protein
MILQGDNPMIYTLIYFVIALLAAALLSGGIFYTNKSLKWSLISFLSIFCLSWVFYFTFLDNYLARHWGGSMTVKLPQNAQMIGMTWKDNSLWYQYYLPATNECVFREDSQIGVVEGEVRTPNCNPVGAAR